MTVSKIRLPDNTEHDIRAKYLIQSSSSDATSAEFSARTVTDDAIANIQKIYGNTVVVSDNLVSNSATAILSRGFNQWDEEWEVGFYSLTSGNPQSANDSIRSKNKIKILPNTSYYGAKPSGKTLYKYFYDANGSFISEDHGNPSVSPASAAYMNIALPNLSPAVYNNNICINISDLAKNGTYEPYNGHQIDLNIQTLTGKLNGTGNSVVIFPDGMKKAGAVYDEIVNSKAIKRTNRLNLGDLTWSTSSQTANGFVATGNIPSDFRHNYNNGAGVINATTPLATQCISASAMVSSSSPDMSVSYRASTQPGIFIKNSAYAGYTATQFKTAVAGIYLDYEIATPGEYILDTALQLQYPVIAGGTEMVLPTTCTAPMKMDVIYGNAADAAATMSQNFISVDSMKEFLAALGTQMGGTWSMGYENGKHTFTFTSN